jgi:hypothetical protein
MPIFIVLILKANHTACEKKVICSSCSRLKINDRWISLADFINNMHNDRLIQNLCPDCSDFHRRDMLIRPGKHNDN